MEVLSAEVVEPRCLGMHVEDHMGKSKTPSYNVHGFSSSLTMTSGFTDRVFWDSPFRDDCSILVHLFGCDQDYTKLAKLLTLS
jgi:hypothetical protein